MARLDARSGTFLPPRDGAPLGVHEPLLENVVKDVLEVEQLRSVADVDELRSRLLVDTRRLVVRDPKFGGSAQRRHVGSVE